MTIKCTAFTDHYGYYHGDNEMETEKKKLKPFWVTPAIFQEDPSRIFRKIAMGLRAIQ